MSERVRLESEVRNERPLSAIAPRLGIIGGGQLAKMTAMAALQLGCGVVVLERNSESPAANLAFHSLVGDGEDPAALLKLASQVDVVTLENEFVAAESLRTLEEAGCVVYPTARSIALVQDKLVQKQTLAAAGLPVPRFEGVANEAEVERAGAKLGWPLLLKARRNAYDGRGNATVRAAADVPLAWTKLDGHQGRGLYVEEFCDFTAELATIVTSGINGETVAYPVVETVQRNHVCHCVFAPARIDSALARAAADLALRAVRAVGAVGSFGVEMFLDRGGDILINELAPRVHNSGHYTIEACACSQFENHVRAILGWPLGSTAMRTGGAVMVNLLGRGEAQITSASITGALATAGASVHLYGKRHAARGRKMGHITALGSTVEEARLIAVAAANQVSPERAGG